MTKIRRQQMCLVGAFWLLLALVAPSQIILDLREGEQPQVVELFRRMPNAASRRRVENALENRCRPARVLRPWVQYARFVLFQDAGDNALLGRDGWLFYRPAVQYLIEPGVPDGGRGDLYAAVLSFRDQLAERGIRLLLMPTPNKASIYPEMLTARAAGARAPVNAPTRDIMAGLRQAGVEVIDLFEAFAEARERASGENGRACYLAQDSHWSPEGMRLAADVAARKILASGRIEKGPVPYRTRPVTVRRHGDVLQMIRAPQIEQLFLPEQMDCTQVFDAGTGLPYRDDPNSPILVLGDSFLRIFEQDEPGRGGFIAHLACHLGFGLTSVVNDGGASTLVRQQLARKPALLDGKQIVLWQFVERDLRFGTEGWQEVTLP